MKITSKTARAFIFSLSGAVIIIAAVLGIYALCFSPARRTSAPDANGDAGILAQSTPGGADSALLQYDSDTLLLARLVYSAAKNQSYSCKVAVAAVALNRKSHPDFPKTLSSVVYQSGAFASVGSTLFWQSPDAASIRAALDAKNGADPSFGALYFFEAGDTERGKTKTVQIGGLVFAK